MSDSWMDLSNVYARKTLAFETHLVSESCLTSLLPRYDLFVHVLCYIGLSLFFFFFF
jgi:hypothetical protein